MTAFYSIDWKRVPGPKSRLQEQLQQQQQQQQQQYGLSRLHPGGRGNEITVRVTCLNASGKLVDFVKLYREWLGVCTDRIENVVREIERHMPGARVRCDRLHPSRLYRKVLPYFSDRVKLGRLESEKCPFYRVYVEDCPPENVAVLLGKRYEIDYFRESDWRVRLYVDLCAKYETELGFFYRWYRVDRENPLLLDAFDMLPDAERLPKFVLGAFDIETVAGTDSPAGRVPDGSDPGDRIVMISLVTWSSHDEYRKDPPLLEKVLFLNPLSSGVAPRSHGTRRVLGLDDPRYSEHDDENDMLDHFHDLLKDVRVLTGYNIDLFDLPCIYSRLVFLGRFDLLSRYSSRRVGDRIVASFDDKIVLDLYCYFKTFSSYDLIGLKLYQVAKTKLGDDRGKIDLDSVGIHAWYNDLYPALAARGLSLTGCPVVGTNVEEAAIETCRCDDASACHELLFQRRTNEAMRRLIPLERFGTFPSYLEYCLRDSHVVRDLFLKESVLGFLTERARLAALDVVEAMHYGNSRFLLQVFQAYGTVLGFFVNVDSFRNQSDHRKFSSLASDDDNNDDDNDDDDEKRSKKRYQGALNYCVPESFFENVSVLDFSSMYPTTLLCSNLCYATCDIMSLEEYDRLVRSVPPNVSKRLNTVPYRKHSSETHLAAITTSDFVSTVSPTPLRRRQRHGEPQRRKQIEIRETYRVEHATEGRYGFRYPEFESEKDTHVIVHCNPAANNDDEETLAFLPTFVKHFLCLRKMKKRRWNETRNVVHYNSQLCIKLLLNSLYGVMASKDSPLAYISIAMSIVALARYQFLGTFYFVRDVLKCTVCYADTDSLMVHRWPSDDCDVLNRFLNYSLPHAEIEFEQRLKRILILSKKRYVTKTQDGRTEAKGFQKKVNDVVRFMRDEFKRNAMDVVDRGSGRGGDDSSRGWILWVETLLRAHYMCRRPWRHAITRKTRKLKEYKSANCLAVKFLRKYPEREGEYIDYTFGRADVCKEEESNWIMAAEECKYVNFEKLFVCQKKTFCTLLNVAFWNAPDHQTACDAVLNTFRWRYFLHAELLHRAATGRKLEVLTERGLAYSFEINDHRSPHAERDAKRRKRKRKDSS